MKNASNYAGAVGNDESLGRQVDDTEAAQQEPLLDLSETAFARYLLQHASDEIIISLMLISRPLARMRLDPEDQDRAERLWIASDRLRAFRRYIRA